MSDVQPWQFVDDEQDNWPDYIDSIITFSFFAGLISFWWFTNKMQVNFGTFCKVSILLSLVILMGVHIYKRFTSIKWVQTTDAMRALLSGPLLTILVFSLNYLIAGKPYEVTYTIADIRVVTKNEITDEAVVFFNDNALNDFKTLRTFTLNGSTYQWHKISYTFCKGIFGITNVTKRVVEKDDGTRFPVGIDSAKNHE